MLVVGVEGLGQAGAEAAERGAAPGLDDHLPGAPLEPEGQLLVRDDPAGAGQRLVPGGAVHGDGPRAGRYGGRPARGGTGDPQVLGLRAPAHELGVHGARGVAARAARVEDGVQERKVRGGAPRGVVRVAQEPSAVRAPLGDRERRSRQDGQPVAVAPLQGEGGVAAGEAPGEGGEDAHGVAVQVEGPAAFGEGRGDPGGETAGGAAFDGGLGDRDRLVQVLVTQEETCARAGRRPRLRSGRRCVRSRTRGPRGVRPRDPQRPVRPPLHPVHDRQPSQVHDQVPRRVRTRGRRQVRGGGHRGAGPVGEQQPGPPARAALRLDLTGGPVRGGRHGGETVERHTYRERRPMIPALPALHRERTLLGPPLLPVAHQQKGRGRSAPDPPPPQLQRPALRTAARLHHRAQPLHPHPQPPAPVVEHRPPAVAQVVHERLVRARVQGAHRHPPDRPARRDDQPDQPANGPGPAPTTVSRRGQPVRVEDHLEAGVVVTVQLLPGVHRRLGPAHGPHRNRPHPTARLRPEHPHLQLPSRRPGGKVAQIGVPVQPQLPVRAPPRLHEPCDRRHVGAREPGAHAAHAGVHRPPPPRQPLHRECARAIGPFEGEDGQQLLQPPLPHQPPLDAQLRRQPLQHAVPRPVDERPGTLQERRPVGVAAHRQPVQEVPEVVAQTGRVVRPPLRRAPVPTLAQERADLLARGDPVPYAGDVRTPPGDRALPYPPVVDVLVQHVDRAREIVRGDHHRRVLVQLPLREREGVPVPEGAPEHLVPRHPVGEQARVPGDVGAGARGGQPAVLPRLLPPLPGQPPHVAGHQIGAGRLQRGHHPLVRVVDDEVVAVRERQVGDGRGGVPDAGVAGRAQPGVLLPHQPEPAVPGGELLGDRRAAVRGAVVDHHHLDGVETLFRHRAQAVLQVVLDVVDGDDDAEERWLHVLVNRGRVPGSPPLTRTGERGPSVPRCRDYARLPCPPELP
ncbi:hypothetical protein SCYAM73S_07462 [Streptomyces cyaneofuscatus]